MVQKNCSIIRYVCPPFTSPSTVDLVVGAVGQLKEGVEVEEDCEDNHQDHIAPAPPHVMLENERVQIMYMTSQ